MTASTPHALSAAMKVNAAAMMMRDDNRELTEHRMPTRAMAATASSVSPNHTL